MTRALVTGASGFIGANLVRRLLADGHETHVLLRRDRPGWRLEAIEGELERHDGDVADSSSVDRAFDRAKPEWVFHLAAHGAYPYQTDLEAMIEANVRGVAAVIAAARRAGSESVILAGSSSEYGIRDHAPAETAAIAPDSDYAVTKAAATYYAMKEARRTGAKITTLRLYSAFGPWEEPTRLWPTLAVHALRGTLPPLADATTARDFVYVDDVVNAFIRAAGQEHRAMVLNIGTGHQSSLADVVELVRARFAIEAKPVWGSMAARRWDTTVWVADSSLAGRVLGWRPRHSVRDGLDGLVAWLQSESDMLARYERVILGGDQGTL